MSRKRWLFRSLRKQRRASLPVGGPLGGDPRLTRRNTTIAATTPTATPPSVTPSLSPLSSSPKTPQSSSSLTDVTKFKFPTRHRRYTAPVMSGRTVTKTGMGISNGHSNKGAPPGTNGVGCTPNGQISRVRHLSTGSSVPSDEAETSISDIAAASNFFDFNEDEDDLYVATPEEHIHNMRMEEKKRANKE